MELLLLSAIAFAAARGVETMIGDKRYKSRSSERTVKNAAKTPTPAGKGAAPTSPKLAKFGAKAAKVAARGTTNSRSWGESWMAGFREAYPEARREAAERLRAKAVEKARREADAKEAGRAAGREAADAAGRGPDPTIGSVPPKPDYPPAFADGLLIPQPRHSERRGADGSPAPKGAGTEAEWERERAKDAEGLAETARKDPEDDAPAEDTGRPHLSVVRPTSTGRRPENGDAMSAIPEIRTLDGLLNALALIKAMCQMRAEEAEAIAADDLSLSNRLDTITAELDDLEVDDATLREIGELRESVHAQSQAAAQYGGAATDAADMAEATAGAASKGHSGIAESVQSSPIEQAAQAGYYNR
jgi:hypothetical protein